MRKPITAILASATFALAMAGVSAHAADLGRGYVGGSWFVPAPGPTLDILEFDGDPDGLYVRRYWREPWGGRHYFPAVNERPVYGRLERIPGPNRKLPPPAEDYFRYWSSPPGYEEELQRLPPPPPPPPFEPKSEAPLK